jgi:elongation of very long chain fatty acids protein 7
LTQTLEGAKSVLTQMIFYNQGMNGGWLRHYSWRCQPVDTTSSELGLRVSLMTQSS